MQGPIAQLGSEHVSPANGVSRRIHWRLAKKPTESWCCVTWSCVCTTQRVTSLTNNMAKVQQQQEPVAIVGFACRLPGGNNSPSKLWEFLERGDIASREVPESRFNFKTHYDGSRKPGTMRPPGGMFMGDVDPADFDASFFEISGADAVAMDPNQRQMLEVVYEGLENAGMTLDSLNGASVACFVGSFATGAFG